MSSNNLSRRKSAGKVKEGSSGSGPERIKAMIISATDKAPASLKPYIGYIATLVSYGFLAWEISSPHLIFAWKKGNEIYKSLPEEIILSILGLLLCFFGGTFSALIAAVEAFRLTGWETTRDCALSLYDDYKNVKEAHLKDEQKDEDNDGVEDTKLLSPSELLARKLHLVLVNVKEPEKVSKAIMGITSSCMSVIAVLRVEFAKTVTLAVSIGNTMQNAAETLLLPVLHKVIPQQYHHWVPTAVNYVCKSIAIAIAWYISKIISAFHSGVKGGLMFSRNIMTYGNKKGYFSLKHEDTNVDEIGGWVLAAIGVYFQVRYGFTLPFPFNILFFPLTLLEWAIIWAVSDSSIQV
eukprot:c19437_g2_i1.p1 GENE.c19437_g2_i1~~c19437_g2_i1.p1  ORF type:complete len:351 (-),score=129.09 c19437_g2_i1:103-1155(-)